MANWMGSARSNFFKVNDEEKFLLWVDALDGVSAVKEGEYYCLLEEYGEGWPFTREVEEPVVVQLHNGNTYEEYDEEIDLPGELAQFLVEGEVAILQEVGAEKLRYLTGHSIAVNHLGETLCVSIEDIYRKVKEEWNTTPTSSAY